MFDAIEDYLKDEATLVIDAEGKPTQRDVQLATAVLLVEMAFADDECTMEELTVIVRTLASELVLEEARIGTFLHIIGQLREEKLKLEEFISAINKHFSIDQKQLILSLVWKVALADGVVDVSEEVLTEKLCQLLGLNKDHRERAKELAQG